MSGPDDAHPAPAPTQGARTMTAVGHGETSGEHPGTPEGALAELEAEMAALWQLRKASARDLAHLLHPRLDPTALPLIATLGVSGAMRPTDLVRTLHLDPSTVSRQIAAVERLALVTRVPDPSDARARLVDLTPAAREQFTDFSQRQLGQWRRSLSSWPPGDVERLTKLLHRLRQDW